MKALCSVTNALYPEIVFVQKNMFVGGIYVCWHVYLFCIVLRKTYILQGGEDS